MIEIRLEVPKLMHERRARTCVTHGIVAEKLRGTRLLLRGFLFFGVLGELGGFWQRRTLVQLLFEVNYFFWPWVRSVQQSMVHIGE